MSKIPASNNQGYKKLILYQKSKELVLLIYKLTKSFPKTEQYVLVPQIRRSAISVAANIVEGYAKKSTKEYIRFLDISIGSVTELELFLELSFELKYFDTMKFSETNGLLIEVKKLLYSYQKSLRVK